jgi:hypothetical protein
MLKKLNRNKHMFYVLQLIVWGIMFFWNYLTPLWDDDLEPAKYENLFAILNKTKQDYFFWNGRVVGQTLFRLLSTGNQVLVSILNALVFILLVWFVYNLSIYRKSKIINNLGYITIVMALMLSIPVFGQTVLWKAGSGNYLWVVTINLWFIWLFTNKNFLQAGVSFKKIVQALGFIVLGLLAGLSSENTSGGTIVILLVLIYHLYLSNNKKFDIYRLLGLISVLIGYITLISAPGSKIRTLAQFGKNYYNTPFIIRALKGFYQVNLTIKTYYIPLVAISILFIVWRYNHENNKSPLLLYGITWVFSGFAIIYALSFSPMGQDGGRPFFGGVIYILIGIFSLAPTNDEFLKGEMTTYIKQVAVISLFISSFIVLPNGFYDSIKSSKAINERYAYIRENAKKARKNKTIIQLSSLTYSPQTKYSVNYQLEDIKNGKDSWPNNLYIDYFNIPGVDAGKLNN